MRAEAGQTPLVSGKIMECFFLSVFLGIGRRIKKWERLAWITPAQIMADQLDQILSGATLEEDNRQWI